jgi:hypothetical protein
MTTLMSFQEKVRTHGQPTTDDRVLYDLQSQFASDPVGFGRVDLFQYRDRLSNSDWEKVTGWRQTATTDQRKAKEEGKVFSDIFKQSEQSLKAAGLVTTGIETSNTTARTEMETRISRFQQEAMIRVQDFQQQNGGRIPNFEERHKIIADMILGVIAETGSEKSAWNITKTPWSTGVTRKNIFAFEAPYQEADTRIVPNIKIEDVPADIKMRIIGNWRQEKGKSPTADDVVQEFWRLRQAQ